MPDTTPKTTVEAAVAMTAGAATNVASGWPPATIQTFTVAAGTGEKAQAAPTFFEQMLAVLPDHAHIVSTPFRWSATWSTPGGVWTIKSRTEPLVMTTVRITGPDTKIVRYADAQPLVGVLRALGALPTTSQEPS